MLSKKDYDDYLAQIEEIERDMMATYKVCLELAEDENVKMVCMKLIEDENTHAKLVAELRGILQLSQ